MKPRGLVVSAIGPALVAVLLLAHAHARAVVPPAWKSTPYLIPAGDTTLEQIFADFRRLMSTPVELTEGVRGPTASSGQALPVDSLLDAMSARHGLNWFVFRNRLYVSLQAESSEARIKVLAARMPELRSYLAGIKLLDERFTWIEIASRDEVVVQGPPAYVALVRESALSVKPSEAAGPPPPPPPEPKQIMTFRLRYASAADDGTGKLGIAALLTRLYTGGTAGYPLSPNVRSLIETARRRGDWTADGAAAGRAATAGSASVAVERELAREGTGTLGPDAAGALAAESRRRSDEQREDPPTFDADPRLNMVIVRDKPSRRSEYERVIAALDLVTEQIALDATVIELPVNAMRDALATISSAAAMATSAAGMPALIVPRNVVERAFEQVSRARQKDGTATILTQGIVFSQDDPFSLDFSDSRSLPQYSTTIWQTLASNILPMKVDNADTERRIGLRMSGSGKYILGEGVALKLELAEDRAQPDSKTKSSSARSTSANMSVELREDQILVLSNSTIWSGEDMKEPRGRAVLLSAQRWQTRAAGANANAPVVPNSQSRPTSRGSVAEPVR